MTDELSLVAPQWIAGRPADGRRGFAINRRPLSELIELGGRTCVLAGERDVAYVRQLLLRAPSALPSGRVPLYICSQCGDLGCGAITVRVSLVEDCYVWSELEGATPARWLVAEERDFYSAKDHYLGVIY